jgi:hypothetical protein
MNEAERYQRSALECIAIAAFLVDPQQRTIMMAMAQAWTRLAEHAAKNDQLATLSGTETSPQSN